MFNKFIKNYQGKMNTSLLETASPLCFNLFSPTQVLNQDLKFRDLSLVKVLSKAKFPVYLANSKVENQSYAMKIFNHDQSRPHHSFLNETRFCFLNHPNIIRTHHIEHERQILSKGVQRKVSYIIMEFAPHGDFLDFMMKYNQSLDEKLVRTYFRQLIEGLEYLHKLGVSHLDLKFENMLLAKDFNLKIADFDLSCFARDSQILSRGTKFYRAPELIHGKCQNTQAADIYSAGIILFALKTGGMLPHAEDACIDGIDFAALLYSQNEEFWNRHCQIQNKSRSFFDDDFKDLFNTMVNLDPSKRPSIQQIKQSRWYNGTYYTHEELKIKLEKLLAPATETCSFSFN